MNFNENDIKKYEEEVKKSLKSLKRILYIELFIFAAFIFMFSLLAFGYIISPILCFFVDFICGIHVVIFILMIKGIELSKI